MDTQIIFYDTNAHDESNTLVNQRNEITKLQQHVTFFAIPS